MAIFVVQMFGTPLAQPVIALSEPTVVSKNENLAPTPKLENPKPAAPAPSPEPKLAKSDPVSTPLLVPKTAQAAPDNLTTSPSAPVPVMEQAPQPLVVSDGSVSVENGQLHIRVTTQGPVSKVVANYGGGAALLEPKSNGTWEGSVDLKKVIDSSKTISVTAYDIAGNTQGKVLAGFSENVGSNYSSQVASKPAQVSVFGWSIDPKAFEYKFYLLFTATILTALVLAIGIRRHVQHLNLIANGSFVAIFAMLFLMTG
jgi:hypothetical protein